jgi:hypothetical protein
MRNNFLYFFFTLFFCSFLTRIALAQDTADSSRTAATDSLSLVRKHNVRRATAMSAILPGAGQIYNKKAWKTPIIYAAFAGMGYLVKFNNDNFRKYENALLTRYDNDPLTVDEFADVYTEDNLRSLSDFYRRNRDLSVVGLTMVYVLNIIDAHVDAQLFNFNVSDDLSLQWSPTGTFNEQGMLAGVSMNLRF